jgi:hypothetical protein
VVKWSKTFGLRKLVAVTVALQSIGVYAADKSLALCLRFISASSISALLRFVSLLGLLFGVSSALRSGVLSAL